MIPYIVFYVTILSLYLVSLKNNVNNKEIYFLILIFTFAFSLLRYDVGADYKAYFTLYNSYLNGIKENIEPGIYFIMKLSQGQGYEFFVAIVTILSLIGMSLLFYKVPKYSVFVLIVYLLTNDNFLASLGFFRQAIAISFFIIGTYYLLYNKKIYSILFFIIGSIFHNSILFAIPFLIISRKFRVRTIYIILPLVSYFISIDGLLSSLLISLIDKVGLYGDYIKTKAFYGASGIGMGFFINYLIFLILYMKKDNSQQLFGYKIDSNIINLYIIYLIFQAASVNFLMLYRIQVIFAPFYCLGLAVLINNSKYRRKKIISISIVMVYIFFFARNFMNSSFVDAFLPYKSIV